MLLLQDKIFNLAMHGQRQLDTAYLVVLSQDEVPVLVDEFLSPSVSPSIHEALGAILLCRSSRNDYSTQQGKNWHSFTFSQWIADQAMAKVQPYLKAYTVLRDNFQVRAPSNTLYECY